MQRNAVVVQVWSETTFAYDSFVWYGVKQKLNAMSLCKYKISTKFEQTTILSEKIIDRLIDKCLKCI